MEIEKPFHELEENGIMELIDDLHINMLRRRETKNECETKMKNLFKKYEKAVTNHNTIGELYTAIIYVFMFLSNCGNDSKIFDNKLTTQLSEDDIFPNLNGKTKNCTK